MAQVDDRRSRQSPATFPLVARVEGLSERLVDLITPVSAPMLRISIAVVYLWFGALKVTNASPVSSLVAVTLPWLNAHVAVVGVGWAEVVLGVALLAGRPRRLVLALVVGHLAGTFLTFVMAPQRMMIHGNPLLLTVDGEFVLKNIVLISAALVLLAKAGGARAGSPQRLFSRQRTQP